MPSASRYCPAKLAWQLISAGALCLVIAYVLFIVSPSAMVGVGSFVLGAVGLVLTFSAVVMWRQHEKQLVKHLKQRGGIADPR